MSNPPPGDQPFRPDDPIPPPGAGLPPVGGGPSDAPPPQPGYGQMPPPGSYPAYQQPPVVIEQSNNNTVKIILIVVAVLILVPCLISVVAIIAVTFLGRSASSRFSSVGSTVRDVNLTAGMAVVFLRGWKLLPPEGHRSRRRERNRS